VNFPLISAPAGEDAYGIGRRSTMSSSQDIDLHTLAPARISAGYVSDLVGGTLGFAPNVKLLQIYDPAADTLDCRHADADSGSGLFAA